MELSSEHNDFEHIGRGSVGIRPTRAGLRVRSADAEPTGLFAAVEMTVLVIVAALAMASIIVSSNEAVDRDPAVASTRHADLPAARRAEAKPAAVEALRGGEHPRPAAGIGSR